MDPADLRQASGAPRRGPTPVAGVLGHRRGVDAEELEMVIRRAVTEMFDGVGIDNGSFVGRERVRANLAFLQMLRETHEERGREFRRGLFQNSGNLVALAIMSLALMSGGWLVGHGFTLK